MNYKHYKRLLFLQKTFLLYLALVAFSNVSAQNMSFDINTWCVKSTSCNPFLGGAVCSTAVIQSTHGSPAFYLAATNSTKEIELWAQVSSSGTNYGEGFTLAYLFKANVKYTVRITHSGTADAGQLYPYLIAALTNSPPRNDDGCNLGNLSSTDVYTSYQFTVSTLPPKTSSFEITPTQDVHFLWLRSQPAQNALAGLLIYKIDIVDASDPTPPANPPPPPTGNCDYSGFYDYCDENWEGFFQIRVTKPITLNCFVLSGYQGPGGNNTRSFYGPSITLAPGFVAIPHVVDEYFSAIASNMPCSASMAADTAIGNSTLLGELPHEMEAGQPGNGSEDILVYPSPTTGIVKLVSGSGEMNFRASKLIVHDQSGKIVPVSSYESTDKTMTLNLSALSSGVYYLSIQLGNKVITKKVILTK